MFSLKEKNAEKSLNFKGFRHLENVSGNYRKRVKIPLMAEYEPKAYKNSALCNCIFAKFIQKIYPDSVVGIRVFHGFYL